MKDLDFLYKIQKGIKSSLDSRFVSDEDILNLELTELPIRAGCMSGGGCGCTGKCLQIVGKVSRSSFESVVNIVKTMAKEDFDALVKQTYFQYRKE